MKKVLTSGTFDILHYGHINLLKRARELGDYLLVACSTDQSALTKGKKCYYSYDIRKDFLKSIRYVDDVIEVDVRDNDILFYLTQIAIINDISIYVLGNDYKDKLQYYNGYEEFNKIVEIKFLERTPNISTTILKNHLDI